MELGSLQFDIFILVSLVLYWMRDQQKWRRSVLLAADFCFMLFCGIPTAAWCIFFVLLTYFLGLITVQSKNKKRTGLFSGLFLIAALIAFGYIIPQYNRSSVFAAVGMSYYSLSLTSYLFDLADNKAEPVSLIDLFLFAGNFATLLSGPIQKSDNLEQYKSLPRYDDRGFKEGILLILWGFFQKTVIANGLAYGVDSFYPVYATAPASRLLFASFFYTFQLYCDFAGYSNIAIGMGKLFGITIPENFARPYLATNIQDFWRRWHIGLSNWFRNYLYIPLGGSRKGLWRTILNTIIVFTVSGLWHGYGINFMIWGLIHGIALSLFILIRPSLKKLGLLDLTESNPVLRWLARILNLFFVNFAWIFFRSTSPRMAFDIISRFKFPLEIPSYILTSMDIPAEKVWSVYLGLILVLVIDLLCEHGQSPRERIVSSALIWNIVCVILLVMIAFCGNFEQSGFLYYNF